MLQPYRITANDPKKVIKVWMNFLSVDSSNFCCFPRLLEQFLPHTTTTIPKTFGQQPYTITLTAQKNDQGIPVWLTSQMKYR